jgi:putative ABC transport system permease protein
MPLVSGALRRYRAIRAMVRFVSGVYLRRQARQASLVVATAALGVAAIVATGSLVESALASLEITREATAEHADLRVANGFAGVPEALVAQVRQVPGVASAGGVLLGTARLRLASGSAELMLLGIDLLSEDEVHRGSISRERLEVADETDFLVRLDAVALDRSFAQRHGIALGRSLEAELAGGESRLFIAGLLDSGSAGALLGGALAVMDLPAAQALLGRAEMVDAIDVKLAAGAEPRLVRERLEADLAGRATVTAVQGESPEWASLLFALRLALGLTGCIAIVVGALVIHHVVAIAASRRQAQLDLVRALGLSRRALLILLSTEGLVLGLAGAALGAVLGALLAVAAAGLFQQTVTSLYAPIAGSAVRLSPSYLVGGCALGVVVTWAASIAPARGALRLAKGLATTSPSRRRWRTGSRLAAAGAFAVAAGVALPWLDLRGLEAQGLSNLVLVSDALVLLGLGFAAPLLLVALSPLMSRLLRGPRLLIPRLAWQGLISDPARSAAVVAAILLGSAYVIYTLAGVASLRQGVLAWMRGTQRSDLVVTGVGSVGLLPSSPAIPGDLETLLSAQPGVEGVERSRLLAQPYADRWVVIAARSPRVFGGLQPVKVVSGDLAGALRSMQAGEGALVTRIFTERTRLAPGEAIWLRSPSGPVHLRIGAVIDDYSGGDLGTVFVEPGFFRRRWLDESATSYEIWLAKGQAPQLARERLAGALRGICRCRVLTRAEVTAGSAAIVDAIFLSAYALELVAGFVTVVSMLSFFAITLEERRREIRLLQLVGATRRQIVASFLCESAAFGCLGGVLGCASGLWLSRRFVEGPLRSELGFGFDFVVPAAAVALVLGLAVAVSLLAAAGPVLRASRDLCLARTGDPDA